MNFKRKLSLISIPFISILPMAVIVSCSSNSNNSSEIQKAKDSLENFLKTNNPLSPKIDSKPIVKNFVEENKWNNVDELIQTLEKYFIVDQSFKNELTKDNNFIYQKIKKFVIQPIPDNKNLKIIFFLDNQTSDKYIVKFEIENALENNFAYNNEIVFPDNHQIIHFESKEEFEQIWKNANENSNDENTNINAIKDILKRAFGIAENDQEKIDRNIKDKKITFSKNSSFQVSIILKQDTIDQGFIFSKNSSNSATNSTKTYSLTEISYPLVK